MLRLYRAINVLRTHIPEQCKTIKAVVHNLRVQGKEFAVKQHNKRGKLHRLTEAKEILEDHLDTYNFKNLLENINWEILTLEGSLAKR
jgi:hypothetical protein